MKHLKLIFTCLTCFVMATAQAQTIEVVQQGRNCSFRGLSVVNNKVAWVSGSKGTVVRTTDGGKTWNWQQVKGFEQADFRDIEAFSDKDAIIMSSGTPALILKTADGGANWQVVYRNEDKAYFLDAMDFTPDGKHGFILGDPIDNKFLLLETEDGGNSWAKAIHQPVALPNEAAFAASGTCIRVDKNAAVSIVTGGAQSRYLKLSANDTVWQPVALPLAHGKSSQGAFSVSADQAIIVGGDYALNGHKDSVSCKLMLKSNAAAQLFATGPAGYQSCVEHLNKAIYLTTGTPGSNFTTDSGQTWKQIDTTSFNVCRKAKHGTLVLLAGDKGKIALFKN